MLTRDQLMDIFRKTHALQRGHFELSSGFHSGHYLQCAQVLQHPKLAAQVCAELARRFAEKKPTVIIGPAIGGVIVAHEMARALDIRSCYAERVEAEMHLRRGFGVGKEDRAVVVEDVITTGESARKVVEFIERLGAKVLGIGAIVDRSMGRADFQNTHYERLMEIDFENFAPHNCPLCNEKIPLTFPGRVRKGE